MAESKITYILEAAQATAAARALSGELDGIGKAAKSSAAGSTVALNGVEKAVASTGAAAVSADPKIAALFASLNTMKGELAAITPVASTAATAVTTTAVASGTAALAVGAFANAIAFGLPQLIAFAGVIIELITAKREMIKVDEDIIATDIARQASAGNMMEEYGREQVVLKDLRQLLVAYREATLSLVEAQLKEQAATRATIAFQEGKQQIDQENLLLFGHLAITIEDLTRTEAEATAVRQAAQKVTDETVRQIITFGVQMSKSAEEVRVMAEAIPGLTGVMPDLIKALDAGALEAERFALSLNKLRQPKFDESGTTAGIQAQIEALKKGLEAAAQSGITGLDERVRFLRPTLSGLSADLKHNAEETAKLKGETLQLITRYRELFDVQKKAKAERTVTDIGPRLELELLRASITLHKEDFELRTELIKREFEVRREEMVKNGQATEENLNRLKTIEVIHLTALVNEHVAYYQKIQDKRIEDAQKQEIIWLKEFDALREHLARQRQFREEESRKFFEAEAKAREARLGRGGRDTAQQAAQEAEELRRLNAERDRAVEIFGRLAEAEELLARQIRVANGALRGQQVILVALASASEQFTQDWLRSGAIFQFVADGISDSLRRMVANGEDFGANMKAVFLELVASLASYWGRLFISMGAGMILFSPAQGAALIAAGLALMALAGVFSGLADRARQAAQPAQAATGGAAGGAAGSGGGGGGGNQGPPNNVIPFPTSGGPTTIIVVNRFDRGGLKHAMKGEDFVTVQDMRDTGGKAARAIRKAS